MRFLRQGGRAWVVVRRLTDGSIQLEADDGELWNAREAETLRLCQTGQLTIDLENSPVHAPPVMTTRELSTYSMPIQQRARRRVAYLQRLLAEGELHFSAKAIMPPAKKWDMGEQARIIEYPVEPAQLRVIFAHTAERRVFHYGVEVNGLRYNSPDLQVLRRRHGEALRVALKYHEDDVGYVHVLDADQKAYFDVPAIDQEYAAGLSLIQHELIRAQLREANPRLKEKRRMAALLCGGDDCVGADDP